MNTFPSFLQQENVAFCSHLNILDLNVVNANKSFSLIDFMTPYMLILWASVEILFA